MTDVDSGQTFIVNSRSTSPADINYHGLLNQGATCYLNSVLQVLFMTGDFREAVERYTCRNPGSEFIDHQLKPLFEDLKKKTANTSKITDKLGIGSVYEQRDAAEFCERILTLTSPGASQIFHGEMTHKTTCSRCRTEMNADGPFWHLPLELVGSYHEHYSVVDGIEEHFRTSYFRGENQMYCDQCDTKSDAAITCVMRRPPEVLMLLLKRFEFDYRHMTYVKNDRVVVVPCALQIPENQTYELYAVVEHFGDLRGGHYTATIKSQDDQRWYNFNDATVTLLDNQPFQTDIPEKSQSVYLLFYRKRKNAWEAFTTPAHGDDAFDVRQSLPHQEREQERRDARGYLQESYAPKCERDEMSRVEDEDNDHGRADKKKVSHMHVRHNYPQICVEMRSNNERTDMDVTIDKSRMTEDEELPEKKRKTVAENLNRHVKHPSSKGLDIVRHMDHDEGCRQGVGRYDGLQHVTADKRGDDEMMEKHDEDRHTGIREQNLTEYDLGRKQGGSSSLHKRHEQHQEERRNVKRAKVQKTGDYETAQRKGSSTTRPYFSEDLEDRDERRLDSFRQNRPEQKISASEENPARKRKNTGDAQHSQIRKGSSPRQEMQSEYRSGYEKVRKSQRRMETMGNVKKISKDTAKDLEKNRGNTERELDPKPDGVVPLAREDRELAKKKRPEQKRRWWSVLFPRRKHSGNVKTTGCFPFPRKKGKIQKRILE
uniref:Ubiquitin carboxyl-terminal hydrolase n=1 Tax=Scophthalmus maximus TaxID=52904 RepID=A0A8D2ZZ25_SCOMX